MNEAKIVRPLNPHNYLYYGIGLPFLCLNKIRHSLRGYTSPRPFLMIEFKKAIEYDFNVVNNWIKFLNMYGGDRYTMEGKAVLELGPGADLGVGLILLMKGAKKYNSLDIHNLVKTVPEEFYEEFFKYISDILKYEEVETSYLSTQLKLTQQGKNDKLNYICRNNFDIKVFKDEEIDLVVSQAAFEHFDDVKKTITQLSSIVGSGAILIAEIDLQTHTRWVREKDPLNIYRYNNSLYNLFRFRGSPNRLRPREYQEILKKNGWDKIAIYPTLRLDTEYLSEVSNSLYKKFCDPSQQMDYLSIIVCATKI